MRCRLRILIVDDSLAYRSQIRAALTDVPWLEVVGAASNGKLALEMLEQKSIDIMLLDMEMPVMDGPSTLKALREAKKKTKVIVFSSSTIRGSEATLEALAAGADDFLAKPIAQSGLLPDQLIRRDLLPKLEQFRGQFERISSAVDESKTAVAKKEFLSKDLKTFRPEIVVIASSTGGPNALETIFKNLKGKLRCPIIIAQHMPPLFTQSLAKRLEALTGIACNEVKDEEILTNRMYVCPGDYHVELKVKNGQVSTALNKGPPRNSVRPAADHLFESTAKIYGQKCMGLVLTGMGEDGRDGCVAIKNQQGGVMIQDEKSSVVFGMPGAVYTAGAFDEIEGLEEITQRLMRLAFI